MSSRVLTSLAEVSRFVLFPLILIVVFVAGYGDGTGAGAGAGPCAAFVVAVAHCACRFADMSLIFITVNCFRY